MSIETITTLMRIQEAIGKALPIEQQLFVSANYHKAADFLLTDTGKAALRTLIEEWQTAP